MERELIRLLPYLLGGMFVIGVLLLLISLYLLRLRRTGAYWRLRRRAGDRGGRLFVLSVGLMSGSVVLAVISGLASLAVQNVSDYLNRGPDNLYGIVLPPDALLTATRDVQRLTATQPPPTLTPTTAPTSTPTPIPPTLTPTFTPTVTETPTATLPPLLNLTAVFNVTPRPAPTDALLLLNSVSEAASTAGTLEAESTLEVTFTAGIKRIYLYISFQNMENGVAWSRVLYRDGVPVQGNTLLWSLGETGSSTFFFGDDVGYDAGDYEVALFVGDHESSRTSFTVRSR